MRSESSSRRLVSCKLVTTTTTTMTSEIGSSLVKIQDDLSKLRQAINSGTHTDGTPIDIHVIEVR